MTVRVLRNIAFVGMIMTMRRSRKSNTLALFVQSAALRLLAVVGIVGALRQGHDLRGAVAMAVLSAAALALWELADWVHADFIKELEREDRE